MRTAKRTVVLTASVLVIVAAILVTGYWPELVALYRFESLGKNESRCA